LQDGFPKHTCNTYNFIFLSKCCLQLESSLLLQKNLFYNTQLIYILFFQLVMCCTRWLNGVVNPKLMNIVLSSFITLILINVSFANYMYIYMMIKVVEFWCKTLIANSRCCENLYSWIQQAWILYWCFFYYTLLLLLLMIYDDDDTRSWWSFKTRSYHNPYYMRSNNRTYSTPDFPNWSPQVNSLPPIGSYLHKFSEEACNLVAKRIRRFWYSSKKRWWKTHLI
jgi:hypothetical protein